MAKKTTKKTTSRSSTRGAKAAAKAPARSAASRSRAGGRTTRTERDVPVPATKGKHLVIVESPTKAKTVNKYLGSDYAVMASVGHVRDLPSRAPKGVKQEVPGVDLEHDFQPTYEVMPDKKKTVAALRKAASQATDVWFATDLDREGEAIAWHLAQALGVDPAVAKRVVFNAITREQIQKAFNQPRPIDEAKVNAQQARRILDRIVGYQVSPLLWKKVAGGLSAGRVQSVAVRVVVDREREIEAFMPEEFWRIAGYFATDLAGAPKLSQAWADWLASHPAGEHGQEEVSLKDKLQWLSQHQCLRGELVEVAKKPFKVDDRQAALKVANALGFTLDQAHEWEDAKGKGSSQYRVRYVGRLDQPPTARIASITTRRTSTRPPAPFITSTLQQAAANRLGFALQRTMRIAQQLYEGVNLRGEGQTGLITYMRTDSTHLSGEALGMARGYIQATFGDHYLPDKPNFFTSSNKAAQEAHEAIRPTNVAITPQQVQKDLSEEQFKLYRLIWERFVACQMIPAQWDSTAVMIEMKLKDGSGAAAVFKATGRTLVEEGFYKVAGVPNSGEDAILPALSEGQALGPLQIDPTQQFTAPPPRYTEASLQKKLEEEGIGRPSTYAAIISTIQDRKYVQPVAPRDKRLYATDLGKVVTDKLMEAFPTIMEVDYTRQMEAELDKVEDEANNWVTMLQRFYGPFRESLSRAMELMVHAKAEMEPAPYTCEKCNAPTVYRFGRNGRFLSCSRYPDCNYAAPIDREGKPQQAELTDILCPECGSGMTRRTGRFGPFLGCVNYPTCKGILKLDPKKGTLVLPKTPPLTTDVPCPKCASPLYLRMSKRGFWLSCSAFPKCRGRAAWSSLEEPKQKELEAAWEAHDKANPVPVVTNTQGKPVEEGYAPVVADSAQDDASSADTSSPGDDAA